MWLKPLFDSLLKSARRTPIRRANRAADRRQQARRLLLEGLEDRSLMAFNVLAEYATGLTPYDVTLADVNGDTRPDMIVANLSGNSIDVRLGNADGTFGLALTSPTGAGPRSVATGDFSGDDIPDVVTANYLDASLLVGNGDGTFQPPQSIALPPQVAPEDWTATPLAQNPSSVAAGDLDADGNLDLVVGSSTYFTYCPYYCYTTYNGYVNVLMGSDTGGLGPAATVGLGAGQTPSAVAIGDIDGDTHADVIAATYGMNVLLGDGTGAVGSPIQSGFGSGMRSVSLGDVDGDGNLDSVSSSGSGLYVQKGDGLGGFTTQPHLYFGGAVNSAVMGDVNGDGKIDLVATGAENFFTCTSYGYWGCYDGYNSTLSQATVLIGNGLGSFALPLTSTLSTWEIGSGYLSAVALADLTGNDGLPELVTIDYYTNEAIVTTNDGDWNPPPSISISDAAVVLEGDSGTVNAVFTVTIVGDHDGISVDYSTANSSAVAGLDYTLTAGTLNFAAGEFSQTISVPVIGEKIDEDFEHFFVNLSNAVGGQFADSSGFGTIEDDDTDPVFSISAPTPVTEASGVNAIFTVTLEGEHAGGVTVEYSTFASSATAGADYTTTAGTLTFGPGETSKEISVPILDDSTDEYDEQFYVLLSNAVGAKISSANYAYGTILDNDVAPLVTIDNVSRNEGNQRQNTSFQFSVSLSAVSGKWVYVDFATADGTATTANSDYFANSGTVAIAPGTLSGTLTVTVRGDKTKEANETFVVNLSGATDGTISDSQGVGTIINDDGGKGGGKGNPHKDSLDAALLADDMLTTVRKRR